SASLALIGDSKGQRLNSTCQVYSRATAYNGACAVICSCYWPDDFPNPLTGRRHD
ncbi:hypothetical protein DOTSEDRAFT_114624, partial [Dothistroma septosporum NZE10]